ncbi:hypothetical protein [Streptomyces sp. 7N604]|uniref:hypothetical protein n=1 Tax=Streptomyces sp. 7N604 TaxID=3457415 RepID=UPI003FD57CE0
MPDATIWLLLPGLAAAGATALRYRRTVSTRAKCVAEPAPAERSGPAAPAEEPAPPAPAERPAVQRDQQPLPVRPDGLPQRRRGRSRRHTTPAHPAMQTPSNPAASLGAVVRGRRAARQQQIPDEGNTEQ